MVKIWITTWITTFIFSVIGCACSSHFKDHEEDHDQLEMKISFLTHKYISIRGQMDYHLDYHF